MLVGSDGTALNCPVVGPEANAQKIGRNRMAHELVAKPQAARSIRKGPL